MLTLPLLILAAGPWSQAAEEPALGPVPPIVDLRNLLNVHIMRRSCAELEAVAQRRREAHASGQWEPWRAATREAVRQGLGPMPFGADGCPLNVRAVSRHERPGYVVENVLFESLPGLDVNASVYLPLAAAFPPPWIPIVVPVGHSAKTRESYQIPAQVFARMGYVAVTFDPPGMGGEKREGNDHFTDGVRCYLTGHSSNRYFVIDAIRCIDYLATRDDIDLSRGAGMTGVSGGGTTTLFATLLDRRIAVAGPSCCAVPNALHPVLDNYAPCVETLPYARFTAYDDIDMIVAAAPAPVLLMAGAQDEVFTESMSRAIAAETAESFRQSGCEDRFGFFLDPAGHAYSVAMALEFVQWMDRWVRQTPDRALPPVTREDCEMLPDDMLACHPRQDRNMYSVNRDMAIAMCGARSGKPIPEAARLVANLPSDIPVPGSRAGKPALTWFHNVQEVTIEPETGIELPATYVYPAREGWTGTGLLYFDDRGRWTDLRQHGMLARLSQFFNETPAGPAVLSVDLRGWGDTSPADTNYDIAGWAHRTRWTSYVSAGLGDHVLAMRIRDALAALAYLRSRPEIERVILGGRGMGGVVALHVAAIEGEVAGVFSLDGLASFESLATEASYAWPVDAFLPNVLVHYDLPELAAALPMPTLIANPLGANRQPLAGSDAEALFKEALARAEGFSLRPGGTGQDIETFVRELVD